MKTLMASLEKFPTGRTHDSVQTPVNMSQELRFDSNVAGKPDSMSLFTLQSSNPISEVLAGFSEGLNMRDLNSAFYPQLLGKLFIFY